jgi:hypothetical protein
MAKNRQRVNLQLNKWESLPPKVGFPHPPRVTPFLNEQPPNLLLIGEGGDH